MYAARLSLLIATAAILVGWGNVEALPPAPQQLLNDEVACERVEKYTTEWFLVNTKSDFLGRDLKSNALFYSQGMSTLARQYAKSNGSLTTIWDVWPCYLYNHHSTPNNPLRCVHADTKQQLRFFENMSRAFAMMARDFATVMHSNQNYDSPPKSGIWARVEWPALQSGLVDSLEKINENRSMAAVFWKYLRGKVQRPGMIKDFGHEFFRVGGTTARSHRSLHKRETPGSDICLPEKELEVFDSIDW